MSGTSSGCGLRFECTLCGECCTNRGEYAYVYVSAPEERALARLLEMPVREFRSRYTFVDEYGWSQLPVVDGRCVFLDPETQRCTVYAARPVQCRTFPFWRRLVKDGEWTDEARELCEGVGEGSAWSQDEAEALMEEMEASDPDGPGE